MLELISKMVPSLVDFAKGTKKNTEDLKVVFAKLDELAKTVKAVEARQERAEIRQQQAEERHKMEMENLLLRLENILLRHGINSTPPNALPEPPQKDAS